VLLSACIIDFGLATFTDNHFSLKDKCGTPNYIDPEILQEGKSYSA
jgi:serine/threonine protein kinase